MKHCPVESETSGTSVSGGICIVEVDQNCITDITQSSGLAVMLATLLPDDYCNTVTFWIRLPDLLAGITCVHKSDGNEIALGDYI